MTAAELLSALASQGITLAVADGNLRCEGVGSDLSEDLVAELRERKAELLSLMTCGQCGIPLVGPIISYWRVLLETGPIYLCSVECVFKAWPWRMEVVDGNCD
jgi:tubulysin polyketide synthase-like protein